ncbi:GTPase HflX [Thermogladius sp. 4427co]|uniref:GTPase HflX n=1 Tax=Thermogladius sp. 4427co TaxID=3450718 RepID=UPI003F797CE6
MKNKRIVVFIPKKYESYIDEEISLVKTVYGDLDEVYIVRNPNPKTYIQQDKLEALSKDPPSKLVVMDILKPSQVTNILRKVNTEVVDRVLLILEVFVLHAGSREALLQIELARIRHTLPLIKDLIRKSKIGELAGFLGPGRYGFEKYYTYLRKRESRIRRELEEISKVRKIRREKRFREGIPQIAISGYTCAGKTTLFNALTGRNMPVGPEPFTTLNPKSARIYINGVHAIVTDTVGFIRDLPPEIIEAFYATLEEVLASDIIILVVDSSKPVARIIGEIETSRKIFNEIGVQGKPIILALNKIDSIGKEDLDKIVKEVLSYYNGFAKVVPVSAAKNVNIDLLKKEIASIIKGI